MRYWINIQKKLLAVILISLPAISNANSIDFPALDIENNSGGATLTDTEFNIDATAFAIVFADLSIIDIPDQTFTLTSTGSIDSTTIDVGYFSGTFDAGSLLTGSFTDLTVGHFGDGSGTFNGDVVFTGGSLAGGLAGGRITGSFTASSVDAKIGAVVPVPAAVWLFGSGMIGLIAVARRKAA